MTYVEPTPSPAAGAHITSDWWPESVQSDDGTTISNITSTSYIAGSPVVSVTFTAPRSGRVGVCIGGGLREDSGGNRVWISYELYLGTSASGTLVHAGIDVRGVNSSGDATASGEQTHGNMSMEENLTPGATYYAQVVYKVSGGTTNDVTRRRIIVFPLP